MSDSIPGDHNNTWEEVQWVEVRPQSNSGNLGAAPENRKNFKRLQLRLKSTVRTVASSTIKIEVAKNILLLVSLSTLD
jgi:hypothetical protein